MDPLEYYAAHHCALFPIPRGSKDPWGIINSFAHDWSKEPAQWQRWRTSHPNCNFGVVAGPSRLIIVDIDVAEVGQEAAWGHWDAWCKSHALPVYMPQFESARGGWHVAFALRDDIDIKTLRQVPLIGPIEHVSKKAIVDLRVGNGYVVSAGSHYDGTAKSEESGDYKLISAVAPYPVPDALIASCTRAPRATAAATGKADVAQTQKVLEWMTENDCFTSYDPWRAVGMILRVEFGDDPGFALWQITNDGTASAELEAKKWQSFSVEAAPEHAKIGSLRTMAKEAKCPHTIGNSFEAVLGGTAAFAAEAAAARVTTSADASTADKPKTKHLKRSGDFVRGFVPPDYLVDGIFQRRFCYSLTAQTGVGKTTIAMLLAAHVAIGKPLGKIDVEKGTVLYFAGENPTDVQMRWLGLTRDMGLDPESLDVIFVEGTKKFSETAAEITQEIIDVGVKLSLVVVDTAAAFFEGDNDNDNVQMGNHARMLRSLTLLPGGPCVLILAHPTKNATDDNLVPRGGGAFLNEVDGNISLLKDEATIAAAVQGKFRGPEFSPINFRLKVVRDHPALKDTKGRQIPTIIAEAISGEEMQRMQTTVRKHEDEVLNLLCNEPGIRPGEMAKALGWEDSRVSKRLSKLKRAGLVDNPGERGNWKATAKAQESLNLADQAAARPAHALPTLTPAILGPSGTPTPHRPGTPPPMPPPPGAPGKIVLV